MSKTNQIRIMVVTCMALFMAMLDNLVLGVALPSIQTSFHASVSDLEWFMNAYTLAFSVLLIPFSIVGERYGRKKVFLTGVALFTAGSLGSALSTSSLELILARALQGIGGAAIIPLSLTLVRSAFAPEQRAAAFGIWSGISGLGLSIGPLVGGLIIKGAPWQMIFWVNIPVGIAALVLGYRWIPEARGSSRSLNPWGTLLLAAGLFGLVLGLERGNREGWGDFTVLGPIVGGLSLLLFFYLTERRRKQPMVEFKLFRRRSYLIYNLAGFWMNAGIFGAIFLLTLFLQQAQGLSALGAGLREMTWTGMTMLCAPLAGFFVGRLGTRPLLVLGLALQTAALCVFAYLIHDGGPTVSFLYLLPAMMAAGAGMGLSFTPMSHGVLTSIPEEFAGEASGVHNMLRELGGVFGIAIGGLVFQHGGAPASPAAFADQIVPALYVCAAMVGVGLLSSLIPSPSGKSQSKPVSASTPAQTAGDSVSAPASV